jgi:hypothetical protein
VLARVRGGRPGSFLFGLSRRREGQRGRRGDEGIDSGGYRRHRHSGIAESARILGQSASVTLRACVRPVRAGNRIHGFDQQSCSPGAPPVLITDHAGAAAGAGGASSACRAVAVFSSARMCSMNPQASTAHTDHDIQPASIPDRYSCGGNTTPKTAAPNTRTCRTPCTWPSWRTGPRPAGDGRPASRCSRCARPVRPGPSGLSCPARRSQPRPRPSHPGPGLARRRWARSAVTMRWTSRTTSCLARLT